jgi:hypothetical protein
MSDAVAVPESRVPCPDPRRGNIQPATLRALHAEWRKLSPDLTGPEGLTERELRLYWTNAHLGQNHGRSVNSWNDLTERQAKFILKQMREATGDGPAWRARRIEQAAMRLWGERDWASSLVTRLRDRFPLAPDTWHLTPAQAHALIEELLSRTARKEIVEAGDKVTDETVEHKIEELREKLSPQRAQRNTEKGGQRDQRAESGEPAILPGDGN